MNLTIILLSASVCCNLWFVFLLLYDRIMETKFVRFLKGIADVWKSLNPEKGNNVAEQEPTSAHPVDIVGKSRFRMTSIRTNAAIPTQEAATSEKGIEVSEDDITFDDEKAVAGSKAESRQTQISDERLDDVFTNIPPSELKYSEDEPEEDTQRASGNSFDEIGEAFGIVDKQKPTNKEQKQAGKVFADLKGTELLEKLPESVKSKVSDLIDRYLYDEPTPVIKKEAVTKSDFVVPTDIEDFNIRDFV